MAADRCDSPARLAQPRACEGTGTPPEAPPPPGWQADHARPPLAAPAVPDRRAGRWEPAQSRRRCRLRCLARLPPLVPVPAFPWGPGQQLPLPPALSLWLAQVGRWCLHRPSGAAHLLPVRPGPCNAGASCHKTRAVVPTHAFTVSRRAGSAELPRREHSGIPRP